MYFLAFIALLTSAHDLKDGLSNKKPHVGWLSWHALGWVSRDIIAILLACFIITTNLTEVMAYLLAALILFARTMHTHLYKFGKDHLSHFYGPKDPPAWFTSIAQIWRNLPWT